MSNTPNNPINPSDPQGPWIYSGAAQPAGSYYTSPAATPSTPPPAPPAGPPLPPAAPRPSPQPAVPAPQGDASLASVIDTIEAIIIALIIALTFRAFIVEAFVIPTGSMAPTLLGAHFKVICPVCGYEFDRNASLTNQYGRLADGGYGIPRSPNQDAELISNTSVPSDEIVPIVCPNCLYPITPEQFPQHLEVKPVVDGRRDNVERDVPFAWANNGDRILVLKYLYSIIEPSRWDVIVFKEPQYAKSNYIKRLIGRPGETVEIVNGDIYIGPPGKTAPEDRAIARKPAFLQNELWQVVYNNDFYPTDEGKSRPTIVEGTREFTNPPWQNPWRPVSGDWDPQGTLIKTYRGAGPATLQFNVRRPYGLNTLGYNDDLVESRGAFYPVGDLRLETLWSPADDAAASLSVTLGRPDNCFRVNWSKEGLKLSQFVPDDKSFKPVDISSVADSSVPQGGKAYRITMENVDHTVRFYIDGRLVLTHETPWTAADAVREQRQQALQNREFSYDARISFDVGGACSLSHLKLYRDLYYTQATGQYSGTPTATQGHPITLGKDEFFAMGDNSSNSLDGRLWTTVFPALDDLGTRPGIVPRRYLLGKAFFVYWPAGFRPSDNIPYPLVPNTGDMGLIR